MESLSHDLVWNPGQPNLPLPGTLLATQARDFLTSTSVDPNCLTDKNSVYPGISIKDIPEVMTVMTFPVYRSWNSIFCFWKAFNYSKDDILSHFLGVI